MKSEDIYKINEANLVLRHFVNLSAKLLPFLHELQNKKNPTQGDIRDKDKIIHVFDNYSFDSCTSMKLLNSNILDLIKESYESIKSSAVRFRSEKKDNRLNDFLKEHQRLLDNWYQVNSN